MAMSQSPDLPNVPFACSEDFDVNDYKCIEVSEEILQELYNGKVEIRGSELEETAIVTSTEVYKVRQADFSNTQLLITPMSDFDGNAGGSTMDIEDNTDARTVCNSITCHYVLSTQPPRLTSLQELLSINPYRIEENEGDSDDDMDMGGARVRGVETSFASLQEQIQASDAQILAGLHELNAIEINGQWRLLDNDYLNDCVDDIITSILESSQNYKSININTIFTNVTTHPKSIVEHCFKMFATPVNEENSDDSSLYCLNESKICLFVAVQLLRRQPNQRMPDLEFRQKWSESVPYGMKCTESWLAGHCIPVDTKKTGRIWELFEERELSPEPKHRFEQLFNKKEKWTADEIAPYLQSLVNSGHGKDSMLLKNSRILRRKDNAGKEIRVYTSRRAKKH